MIMMMDGGQRAALLCDPSLQLPRQSVLDENPEVRQGDSTGTKQLVVLQERLSHHKQRLDAAQAW